MKLLVPHAQLALVRLKPCGYLLAGGENLVGSLLYRAGKLREVPGLGAGGGAAERGRVPCVQVNDKLVFCDAPEHSEHILAGRDEVPILPIDPLIDSTLLYEEGCVARRHRCPVASFYLKPCVSSHPLALYRPSVR